MFASHYSLLRTPIITNKPVANLYRDVRFILDVYLNIQPRPIFSAARLSQDWLVSPDPSQEYQNRGLSEPQRSIILWYKRDQREGLGILVIYLVSTLVFCPSQAPCELGTWCEVTNERPRMIQTGQWEGLMSCQLWSSVSDANLDIIFIRRGCPGVMLSKERVKRFFTKYPPGKCDDNRWASLCSRYNILPTWRYPL